MSGLKQKLISMVEADLKDIEDALNQNLNPHVEMVRETAGHLIFSGGKRIRQTASRQDRPTQWPGGSDTRWC